MTVTKEIEVEDFGVSENKERGFQAWITSTNLEHFNKFCETEAQGKATIRQLVGGAVITITYNVKGQFNNFTGFKTIARKTEQKTESTKPLSEQTKKVVNEHEKEEAEVQAMVETHYRQAIEQATKVVGEVIPQGDLRYIPVLTVILERLTTPLKYLEEQIRREL